MRGTLRRKKDKTRLVLFPHQVKIENALKSIKTVTELELTDRNVSKSLLSSNWSYILLLVCCSHKNASTASDVNIGCGWQFLLHNLHFLLYVHLEEFSL